MRRRGFRWGFAALMAVSVPLGTYLWVALIVLLVSGCATSEPAPRPTTYTCGDPHYYHPLCEIGR